MMVEERPQSSPRKADAVQHASTTATRRAARDARPIYQPAEVYGKIPLAFQTKNRRFTIVHAAATTVVVADRSRPSTVGAGSRASGQIRRLGLAQESIQGLGSVSLSSYLPQIQETQSAREAREQRVKHSGQDRRTTSARRPQSSRQAVSSQGEYVGARSRRASATSALHPKAAKMRDRASSREAQGVSSVAMSLDRVGMEAIFEAFREMDTLNEDEFISEMLLGLKALAMPEHQRLEMTGQLSALFRQADVHARGVLTWDDFSASISQTADVATALEDTVINKYQADVVPASLNFVAEVNGMFYLSGANQVVMTDTKNKGIQVYNAATNRVRYGATTTTPTASSTTCGTPQKNDPCGAILDAVYAPQGRYIITASTSPVLTFYDVDQLRIRQSLQTALALLAPSSHGSCRLFSAGANGQVHAWNMDTLTCCDTYFHAARKESDAVVVNDLEVLPETAQLACGSMDGKIYMVDMTAGKVTKTLSGHTKGVSMLRYCAENKYLISGGIDHNLQVWNPHLENKIGSLPGHRSQLIGLHVRSDTPEVITADESGVIKIWDLRKFAAVQTIVREMYVKGKSASTIRPMTAMCYMDAQQRIAIAHSTVFFLDPRRVNGGGDDGRHEDEGSTTRATQQRDAVEDDHEQEEDAKPLAVTWFPPFQCFFVVTAWHLTCWDAATGCRVQCTSIPLGPQVTCVDVVPVRGHECFFFVGCDDGSVARLMLPHASVAVHKRIHRTGSSGGGEVRAIRCCNEQKLVFSSGNDGNVIVSRWESLEPVHVLNHWRGVLSVRSFPVCRERSRSRSLADVYSVPLHLRPFFMGNEIDRLKEAFAVGDPHGTGKLPLAMLPHVLEQAFPSLSPSSSSSSTSQTPNPPEAQSQDTSQLLTFTTFVEIIKDALAKDAPWSDQRSRGGGGASQAAVSSFDFHSDLRTLVTTSSTDGSFCVWNLRNAAVVGEGTATTTTTTIDTHRPSAQAAIAMVVYLAPLPLFVCVEENSPRFSLWSSGAISGHSTHVNQCLVRYTNTSDATGSVESRPRSPTRTSTTFLTEPDKSTKPSNNEKQSVVSPGIQAIHWYCSERDDTKLLCIGDEAGDITTLDFQGVVGRLEDLKNHHKPATADSGGGLHRPPVSPLLLSPTSSQNDLFPATLLKKLHRWSTHRHVRIGIRDLQVAAISSLIQPQANTHAIVTSISENGAVQLWSLDGQLLGRLGDVARAARSTWKLHLDAAEFKQKTQEVAAGILRRVDQRLSVVLAPSPPEPESPGDPCAISRPSIVRDHFARTRPSPRLSSHRLKTGCPPTRNPSLSAEDALVAYRKPSSQSTAPILQSHETNRDE